MKKSAKKDSQFVWPVWSKKWWQFKWDTWFSAPPEVRWQVEFFKFGFVKVTEQSPQFLHKKLPYTKNALVNSSTLPREMFFKSSKFFELWAYFEAPKSHHKSYVLKIFIETVYLPEMVRESFVLLGQRSRSVSLGETNTQYELEVFPKEDLLITEILTYIVGVSAKYPSKQDQ